MSVVTRHSVHELSAVSNLMTGYCGLLANELRHRIDLSSQALGISCSQSL